MLEVRNLKAHYHLGKDWIRAVDGVSLAVLPGETLGLMGESGCGKSTLALSLLRVLPPNGRIVGGQVFLEGTDLLQLSDSEIRKVRWKQISMVFQGSMNSLNPVYRVGETLREPLRVHEGFSASEAYGRVAWAADQAGFPRARLLSYPHELSGGLKQRAVIAMALVCNPKIVIADEPTTALDVVVQALILRRIKTIQRDLNLALVLVSHDAAIIAQVCDRVAVMYAGQIFEYGTAAQIYRTPANPYTVGLMGSVPVLTGSMRTLVSIPGVPPDLRSPPVGCRFATRCPIAESICREQPPALTLVSPGHWSRCHFANDARVLHLREEQLVGEGSP